MSSTTPNPNTRALLSVPFRSSTAVHPDYVYWSPEWEKIRDAEIGEVEVKRKGEVYLPRQATHDIDQYRSYLKRAVFYNMTARTLNALYGTVFSRLPKVTNLPPKLKEASRHITKEGLSLHLMAKMVVKEVLAVGRYGMLVDSDPDGRNRPYVACYTAENILDWEMKEINGTFQLSRVVLREIYYDREDEGTLSPYKYKARYRVLLLEEDEDGSYVYSQFVYEDPDHSLGIPDVGIPPREVITPTVRGEPLDYIPFIVVGPFTNHPDVQKPPLLDIVLLNYAHYMSYAQLEQALFYTGSPVFAVKQEAGTDPGDYKVGPDTVWILSENEDAKVLEFNGRGLQHLENSLRSKEAQIASIGGRLMPGVSRGAAESDNSLLMQERNEQTLLLNITDTVDEAITQILRWWADWNNVSSENIGAISFELSRDFLTKDAGAREFRAIHQMYAEGVIPINVVYDYLKRFEVIPEWMDESEYIALLNDAKQFPNMVDVLARMRDFPDAKTFYEYRMAQAKAEPVVPGDREPIDPGLPTQARAARSLKEQDNVPPVDDTTDA